MMQSRHGSDLHGRDWFASAEGATASETLRQKDHVGRYNLESDSGDIPESAEGVILSGKNTDEAPVERWLSQFELQLELKGAPMTSYKT